MHEDILTLSRRLARMKIRHDKEYTEWFHEPHNKSGLPSVLGPFYIMRDQGPGYVPTGTWSVRAAMRHEHLDPIVFGELPDEFTAFRKAVDVMEAWQLIRPIERVYFIGTALRTGELIKVGYSRDPNARLKTLQTGHGKPLQIFATIEGGKDLEAKYHRRWRTRRREGEWFTVGDCIIDEINRILALTPPSTI